MTALSMLMIAAGIIAHPPSIEIEAGALADWVSGLGSLAAVIVALFGFRIVERQRASDKRDVEKGIAYELVATVLDIANNLLAIDKHLTLQRNDMTITKPDGSSLTYRSMNPLIGLSSEGELFSPPGSTELLIKAKADSLWNDVRLLVNRNRAITSLMKEYREIWQAMLEKLPTPEDFTGQIGHIAAEPGTFANLQGDLIRIDSVVAALDDQVADTMKLLKRVTGQIGPVMRTYFNEPFLHLGPPSEKPKPNGT